MMKLQQLLAMGIGVALLCLANLAEAQSGGKGSASKQSGSEMKPVPVENGIARLSPENTKIEFVGVHVGKKPDPRLGGFEKFSGQVKLAADNSVESVALKIDMNSIWTEFDKLTAHLKNAEFFDTGKYSTAEFTSSKIEPSPSGMKVTGKLTMHGVTKEISFPVKGKLDGNGVVMISQFQIDRTLFGMDQMTSGVDKTVSVKFVVGQKTSRRKSMPGPGTTGRHSSKPKEKTVKVAIFAPNMT